MVRRSATHDIDLTLEDYVQSRYRGVLRALDSKSMRRARGRLTARAKLPE